MVGQPFRVTWGEGDKVGALKAAYQREGDIELRRRLQGLWLLWCGWRLALVAAVVGVHYRTVQEWVGWYREGGLPEVLSHKMGGKGQEPYLTDGAQGEVAEEVATGRFRTAGEIRDWIAEHYGVAYTKGGTYSLMRRLRCAPKVPRPVHVKADPKQQASWKKGGLGRRWWKPE